MTQDAEGSKRWHRLIKFLDNHGVPVLKDVLHTKMKAPDSKKKLYGFLKSYQSDFQTLNDNKQKEKIFPSSKETFEGKFDITTYFTIINRILKHFPEIQDYKETIYELKELRNRLYHLPEKIMTEKDFCFDRLHAADLIADLGFKIHGLTYVQKCLKVSVSFL